MSLELVRGITDTSRRFVTQAIADWIQSGQPLDKLVEVLRPMYGPVRAEMIAATEVTRAYAEGNQVAWQESGVVAGMRWQSSRDELVCPICGPLHGQEVPLGSKFQHPESGQEYFPPAHVRCRCWIAPVVRS
jgi:SPP1 gp7 family putative phage head morphogenesis protein